MRALVFLDVVEHAADRYAKSVGVGPQLARAVPLTAEHGARRSLLQRLVDRHPSIDSQVQRLSSV